MAAQPGRALLVDLDDFAGGAEATIVGQTTGSINVNREAIDITNKDDSGVQTLLKDIGKFSCEVSFEGVMEDSVLAAIAFDSAPTALGAGTITIGTIGTVTGDWFLSAFSITGEDGPNYIGYTATLMSSGDVTFA